MHTRILLGLIAQGLGGGGGGGGGGGLLLEFALFQPLDVMAQLQCGPQFQTHVFHDHVAAQEHQSFSINLLQRQTRRIVKLLRRAGEERTGRAQLPKRRADRGFLADLRVS